MNLFTKLMIAVMFIAILLPFTILKDNNGDTLLRLSDISLPDFSMPDLSKLSGKTEAASQGGELDGKDIFYKWYDADGNVQFTSEPPPQGIEFMLKGFDPNTNVIPALKAPPGESRLEGSAPTQKKLDNPEDIGKSYSQDSVKKLFEYTKNIEKLLKQRFQDHDS